MFLFNTKIIFLPIVENVIILQFITIGLTSIITCHDQFKSITQIFYVL